MVENSKLIETNSLLNQYDMIYLNKKIFIDGVGSNISIKLLQGSKTELKKSILLQKGVL